jgi:tetratricopeptide (TPR) repeat protein
MTAFDRLNRLLDYLAQDPRNPALLADVADLQLQLGDWAAAKASLQQLLNAKPGDAQARYLMAVAERAAGDAARAASLLQALIEEGQAHPVVLQELARCQAQQGRWAAVCPTLLALNPAELPPDQGDAVRLLRIRAWHHQGELEEALAEARRWQAERASDLPLQGRAAIATLLLDLEHVDEAAQLLAPIDEATLASDGELAAAAGFVALSQGRLDAALQRFSSSERASPGLGRAYLGSGLSWAAQGKLPEGIQALKRAVGVAPKHLGGWHALAWMQLLSEDVEGASASFQAALAQDDNFGESHGGLALIAALRGDREAAQRLLRTALRLDPNSTNALVAQAVLERGPGALDAEMLQRALGRFTSVVAARNPALRAMFDRFAAGRA